MNNSFLFLIVAVAFLATLGSDLKRYVKPAVVVVTGDLTDAKTADYSGSEQYLEEWQSYQSIVRSVTNNSDILWLDIRGNHDNFDVPSPTHRKNLFRDFSSQGQEGNIGSYLRIVSNNGVRLGFLAVDATLTPGPRRPFNFVGALNKKQLARLSDLANKSSHETDGTIWFGHYPTSTIISPSSDLQAVMSSGLIYLCGHLHNLHGLVSTMFVRHKTGLREAELTDWKDNRHYRVLALDHGLLSWLDVNLASSERWPVVLVTWPPRAGSSAGDREPTYRLTSSTHTRLLVFSRAAILRITVRIDDSREVEASSEDGRLWTAPWNPVEYQQGLHVLRVSVEDEDGQRSDREHQFSLDGSSPASSFIGQLVLLLDMVAFFQCFFSLLVLLSVGPLSLVRLNPGLSLPVIGKFLHLLSSRQEFYFPLVGGPLYLTVGPWFIGEVLSGSTGIVFCWGTFVCGSYLPTATTWLYGSYHLLTAHLPLTIGLAAILNARADIHAFYKAYGLMAVIFGPFRTGYLLMSVMLWRKTLYMDKNQIVNNLNDFKPDKLF